MVREDMAHSMWCPFARVGDDTDGGAYNRTIRSKNPTDARCIGCECMAWRDIEVEGFPEVEFGRCGLVPVIKED